MFFSGHSHSHSHAHVDKTAKKKKNDDESEVVEQKVDKSMKVSIIFLLFISTLCFKIDLIFLKKKQTKVHGWLNLAADFAHNFTDGLAIGENSLQKK